LSGAREMICYSNIESTIQQDTIFD